MSGENLDYVLWVKTLPCKMRVQDACSGPTEAHHAGRRGLGQKAHDETCIPLCTKHHRAWHDASGVFKTWRRDERRKWTEKQIRFTQAAWNSRPNCTGQPKPVDARTRLELIAERAAKLRGERSHEDE